MKKVAIITGALMAAVFASSVAMADGPRRPAPPAPGHHMTAPQPMFVGVNTNMLDKRIDAGVKNGKLTKSEERQLRAQLKGLEASIKAAKKDRRITAWERTSLKNKETQLNRNIIKLVNNRDVVRRNDNRHDNNRHDNNRR